jgi:hypothetical protein
MDRERNLDSIRELEKQIQEQERALTQLKRARNSLLNVSTLLPPEVLGNIFRWNVIPDGDFGGLPKASYNFLLVCHHWFQVASGTPGLWGFWGNSIEDWAHRHIHCRTAPLDLVLIGRASDRLDDTLRGALQDRAARDAIRRVHLKDGSGELLNSIISCIITEGEETRSNSMKSFMLWNTSGSGVDVSYFFSQYHFPKLQRLDLHGCSILSWDLLRSQITSLTTLSLTNCQRSPIPTLSQMLSILSANPNLQSLILFHGSIPHAYSDGPSPIQLRHLKRLHLTSDFCCVFGLLNQLELPDRMDSLHLSLFECSPSDLPRTLGPYLGNHIRRRSPGGLKLSVDPGPNFFTILVGDACKGDLFRKRWFVTVNWVMTVTLGEGEADELCFNTIAHEADKLCFDVIAYIPQEEVVEVKTTLPILCSENLCVQMCNLAHLHLDHVDLSTWFVEPVTREPHVFKDLLRGLRSISITRFGLSGDDWSPLTNFLARRAAVGNRISSLSVRGYPPMGKDVVESIRRTVEVFEDMESDNGSDSEGDDGDDNESDGDF